MEIAKTHFIVCGYGRIGKRHAAMVAAHPEAELQAIVEPLAWQREEAQNQYPALPCYGELAQCLHSEQITAKSVLAVCTPNALHTPQGLEGLKAGWHVLIEKPMALKKSDAEELIHASLQTDRKVFAVMQNRYSPPSLWLKGLVESGRLGRIFFVQINCFWNRDARYYTGEDWRGSRSMDGGTLFTQFSHFVDTMYWLFGDISNISSRFFDFNHQHLTDFEDSGIVRFDFLRGGSGTFQFSTAAHARNMESSLTILAEQGSIKVGGQYMNEVLHCEVADYQMPELAPASPPNDYGGYQGSAANHHYVIANVVDALNGRGPATTNALEGLKVVDIIERMYAATD